MTAQGRPTLSERRAEQFRLDIAMAARGIFLAEASTSATVERICEAVGIAPRTFHRHFPVKEDVVMPLFREFGRLSIQSLQQAPSDSDTVDTLVEAFATEVPRRGQVEIDRRFLELMLRAPQYRLRWLDWGEGLAAPDLGLSRRPLRPRRRPVSSRPAGPPGDPNVQAGLRLLGGGRRFRPLEIGFAHRCRDDRRRTGTPVDRSTIVAHQSFSKTVTATNSLGLHWHRVLTPARCSTDRAIRGVVGAASGLTRST